MYGDLLYDNEPHASASLYYGTWFHHAVMDRPAIFGDVNEQQTLAYLGITDTGIQGLETLARGLVPYRQAISNFAAETVNFFLEDGKLTTILSEPVNPYLTDKKTY